MSIAGFIAYAGALALAASIPGPGLTALIARALGSGFRPALVMSFGLILGDLTYLTAVVLGLAVVAQSFGLVFLVVKWAGVAYLAWLAYRFWTAGIVAETVTAETGRGGLLASFASGITITLGNPKTMIFYLAITPTVIDVAAISASDYAVLAALTALVLVVVLVPYLALAAHARRLFARPAALRWLNRTAATFLGGAAAAIALRG
ncbi:MAG: LysE family translocator [Nitratireductor sp.]